MVAITWPTCAPGWAFWMDSRRAAILSGDAICGSGSFFGDWQPVVIEPTPIVTPQISTTEPSERQQKRETRVDIIDDSLGAAAVGSATHRRAASPSLGGRLVV